MTSLRTAAGLGAGLVLSLSALAGCSGSEDDAAAPTAPADTTGASTSAPADDPAEGESGAGDDGAGDEPAFPLIAGDPCDTSVEVTGDVEQSWDAEGAVSVSRTGPPATYQSSDGATVLTVYAKGNGYARTFVLAVGLDSYALAPGTGNLDVAADGSAATVDGDATTLDGTGEVHVTATYTC